MSNKSFSPVDVPAGEQMKPEFLKINPTHTLPTLDDGGFILWDSHAIMTYLITKYGNEDHPLYPKDVVKRAKIDQFLNFDGSTLFPRFFGLAREAIFEKRGGYSEYAKVRGLEALSFMNTFLENVDYLVDNQLSLADLSCVTVTETLLRLLSNDESYPNVSAWIKRLSTVLPYYAEVNDGPSKILLSVFQQSMASKAAA